MLWYYTTQILVIQTLNWLQQQIKQAEGISKSLQMTIIFRNSQIQPL